MVEGNHWDQWFSDGFGVRQPLVTMVFDGCASLVRQWNGYVSSLKSKGVDEDTDKEPDSMIPRIQANQRHDCIGMYSTKD